MVEIARGVGVVLMVLTVGWGTAQSAFEMPPAGARTFASGAAGFALERDLPSSLRNPAVLSTCHTRSLALFHSPGLFGLNELRYFGMAYCEPLPYGVAAAAVQRFGTSLYSETTIQGAFGCSLGVWGALGLSVRCLNLTIDGYGSNWGASVTLGAIVNISSTLRYGVALENVFSTGIGETAEPLPRSVGMSFAYSPAERVQLLAGAECDFRFPVSLGLALECLPVDVVSLRAGVLTEPDTYALGAGFNIGHFECAYSVRVHSVLGPSHMFGLSIMIR